MSVRELTTHRAAGRLELPLLVLQVLHLSHHTQGQTAGTRVTHATSGPFVRPFGDCRFVLLTSSSTVRVTSSSSRAFSVSRDTYRPQISESANHFNRMARTPTRCQG